MKPKTVILLVICGSLLLFVGTLAVFFARGGEVLYWGKMVSGSGGDLIGADEAVAQEIAKLDFTFSPIEKMTVHFRGFKCVPSHEGNETSHVVLGFINVNGKSLRAFPSGREYRGMTGEEFWKHLHSEIQSRIPEGSEFHIQHDRTNYITHTFQEYPERFRQNNK